MIGKNIHLGENKNQLQHVTLELATDLNSYTLKIVISLLWSSAHAESVQLVQDSGPRQWHEIKNHSTSASG